MTVSVLVAFRDDSPEQFRQRLWDFVRHRLEVEHPEYEVVVRSDDGTDPFNKCVALNRAAAAATGDVFYILDSDSWVPPANVRTAVEALQTRPRRWWRPWRQKVKFSERHTAEVLRLGERWDGIVTPEQLRMAENRNRYWSSPPLLVHRDLFEAVDGFDERFRGWGQEDDAFAWSLTALFGKALAVEGQCVHLFHPRRGRSGRDLWPGQETFGPNLDLVAGYRRAARTPEGMRALIAQRTTTEGAST